MSLQWLAVGLGFGYLVLSGTISYKTVLGVAFALGAGGLGLLYRFQESLLYQPRIFPNHLRPRENPPGMRHPGEVGLPWEDVRLTTEDGLTLHAWFIRPDLPADRRSRPTLLFFHENAGNMGMRMESYRSMFHDLQLNVLALSYRGYGESEGVPSEEGLYLDGAAALKWLLARDDIDRTRIILFGRSLGGGVAIDLASKLASKDDAANSAIAALIVENTFASISSMVDVIFPYLAAAKRLILRMKWESINKIKGVKKPILFISGEQDEIVPSSQMSALYAAATSSVDRQLVLIPNGRHNDTWMIGGQEYLRRFREFLQKHVAPKTEATRSAL